jgi:hypothetical protein
MMCRLVLGVLLIAATPSMASAQLVVDRCGSDTETGGTRNLAQALAIGGNIVFACPPGTQIRITRGHTVPGGTSIDGEGNVTLDAHGLRLTLFYVNGSFLMRRLSIQNVALRRSSVFPARASVLWASGDVSLDDVTIGASETPVLIRGNAEVRNSAFLGNSSWALSIDGEARVDDCRFIGNGTGVSVKSGYVRNSVFSKNTGGALRITHPTANVTVTGSQFLANAGQGAIVLSQRAGRAGAVVVLKRNRFIDNANTTGGGAITVLDSTVGAPAVALPALMRLPPAKFEFAYNRFERNHGSHGGAINASLHNTEGLVVNGGIFVGNVADGSGGAVFWVGRSVLFAHSVFRANRAQRGGALFADYRSSGSRWVLANSLVAENVVVAPGAAVEVGPIELLNVTVARNDGIGFAADVHGSPPTLPRVVNTIISENQAGNCRGVAATSFRGGNLQFGRRDCAGVTHQDPFLDALYVPLLGSAALSLGDVAACRAAPVSRKDIVFQSRATDNRCATGAFERPPVRRVPPNRERRGDHR